MQGRLEAQRKPPFQRASTPVDRYIPTNRTRKRLDQYEIVTKIASGAKMGKWSCLAIWFAVVPATVTVSRGWEGV